VHITELGTIQKDNPKYKQNEKNKATNFRSNNYGFVLTFKIEKITPAILFLELHTKKQA
jgi:hypothetical protein